MNKQLIRRVWRIVSLWVIFTILFSLFVRKEEPVLVALAYAVASFLMFVISRKVGHSFPKSHFFRNYFRNTQILAMLSTVAFFAVVVIVNLEYLDSLILLCIVLAHLLLAGTVARVFYVGKALKGKIKGVPTSHKSKRKI